MKRACLIVLCVLVTLSCDGDKPSPLPTTPTPPTTPVVVLSSFTVQGPAPVFGPGETARVQALARFSDGSERDVAAEATWTSSQVQIATVEAGVITGRTLGRTTIRAQYQGRSSSLRIVVQPAGTFILSGNIVEPGPINVGMATIAVLGGSYQVTATSDGFFELFGVAGTITVRVSKPGYLDETRTLSVTFDHGVQLEIRPRVSPTRVAGTYRVTLTIPPSCSAVPDDQKVRTYTAVIEQTNALLLIRLRDANLVPDVKNLFEGKVNGDMVTLNLGFGDPYYYYYYNDFGIQELLPDGQVLKVWGSMVAQAGTTMSGNLVGGFRLGGNRNRNRQCASSEGRLDFTRN